MAKVRLIVAVVLALLVVIIIFQNTEPVETRILFATITMPRAVLLLVTTVIGFASGIIVSFLLSKRKKGTREGSI